MTSALIGCRGQVTPTDEPTSVLRCHICGMKETLSLWWCHACVTVSRSLGCVMHSVMWWWIGHLFVLFDRKGQQCCTCVTLDHCDTESEKRLFKVWMDDFSFYHHSQFLITFLPLSSCWGWVWPVAGLVTLATEQSHMFELGELESWDSRAGDGITCCLGARYWTRRQVCGDNSAWCWPSPQSVLMFRGAQVWEVWVERY